MKQNLSMLFVIQFLILSLHNTQIFAEERFTDNNNGTVTDHQLGLMWAKNDNFGDINWHQASRWIRYTFPATLPVMYDNWRLPTLLELKSIYNAGKGYKGTESECGKIVKIAPEINLTCSFIWSSDRQDVSAQVFNFSRGTFYSDRLTRNRGYRALAVRDVK